MALADLVAIQRNEQGISAALGILKQRFGERFQTNADVRRVHSHTTTYIPSQLPDGVAFLDSREEVGELFLIHI